MWEMISSWTVEVNIGFVLIALGTMAGAAMVGYSSGIVRGGELVDEHLHRVGIHTSETENRIEVHEAGSDKIVMAIWWDDEYVDSEVYDLEEQEWDSEST